MRGEAARDLEGLVDEALYSKEPIKKPIAEPLRPQGLLEKLVLSKWTAPIFAAAMGAVAYITPNSPPTSITENLAAAVTIAGLGYATAKLIRQDWLIRNADAVRRKVRPLPVKILNTFSEHPEIIAGAAAAYFTANLVSSQFASITPSDLFRHLAAVPAGAESSAVLFSTFFVRSYTAVSLTLGRVFHPETAKTFFNSTAALTNAWRGNYKKAAENFSQLLKTQRSYSKAVALQTLIGDFQLLDQDLKCFDTYINAISTEKTSYVGRGDWVIWALSPFIELLKQRMNKVPMPKWAEANDLSYIVAGVYAFAKGRAEDLAAADTAFRLAVKSKRDSVLAHTARATFLRKTGQDKTADLEMMVRAEQVMNDPNAERVVVEGRNRNTVFFSGNVAVKQNKNAKPVEDEQAIVGRFRDEFGSLAIYPLPVYKREGLYHFLSEKYISETLLDLIKQGKAGLDDFIQASEMMVQFQRFGLALYKKGELPLDDSILRIDTSKPETMYFANRRRRAIEQVERFNGVKMPESYKAALGYGSAFVDRILANSRLLTMYKDFGPKNVLKRLFGQMQVLDFELDSLRLLPPQLDFVNLTESEDYLSHEQLLWLRSMYFGLQERANKSKIDREEFEMVHFVSSFQWHYERLMYSTAEAASARTPEQRQQKKKDQVRHLLAARASLDTIIERKYIDGKDLEAALEAREELKRPIFQAEYDELCGIVEREKREHLLKESLPASNAKLAFASAGAFVILTAAVTGGVIVRNNLVPIANVPVFQQGDKVLLAVSETDAKGYWQKGPGKVKYFVIDSKDDSVRFLTDADNATSVGLSAFQDKAVFIKNGKITLYDFLNRKFRPVKDKRFENPAISPNGLWIASNLRMEYLSSVMSELWLIRPTDMLPRKITDFPNAFLPYYGAGKSWSPDGSYLVFLSNNETAKGESYPDSFKVWINTLELSSGTVYPGPFIGYRGRGVFTWSPNGSLAYLAEKKGGEPQRIYISDPKFKDAKEVYVTNGYVSDGINLDGVSFIGPDHLAIESLKQLSLLDTTTMRLSIVKDSALGLIEDVSKNSNRFLYLCHDPFDICEFNVDTGESLNLTNTPARKELSAVYSPNQKRLYVVSSPPVNCLYESCVPSLSVMDISTGTSRLLMESGDGRLRYSLIHP